MRRRTYAVIGIFGIIIGIVLAQNWMMVSAYFTTLTLNAGMILIYALIGLFIFYIIYYVGVKYDLLFKLKLSGVRGKKRFDREHCIETSKELLENHYKLETYLEQHGRSLTLAFDPVIESLKGIPIRLMIWTSVPFEADRDYDLEKLTRDNFDQLFFVEVNLLDGQPSKLPFTLEVWKDWAYRKHILSRTEEREEPFKKRFEEKVMEGMGIKKGEQIAEGKEVKEEKE